MRAGASRGQYERLYREWVRTRGIPGAEDPRFVDMMKERIMAGRPLPSPISVDPKVREFVQRESARRGKPVGRWERGDLGQRRRRFKDGYLEVRWEDVVPKRPPWLPFDERVGRPLGPDGEMM